MNPKNQIIGRRLDRQLRYFISILILIELIWLSPDSSPNKDTKVALAASDPVIAAAGDIACDPTSSSFNAGNGTSSACRQKYTSDLLINMNPAAVLALGDNQYYCGGYDAFMQSYNLSWGKVKAITHPVVGNHEYLTSGGTGCTPANGGAAGHFSYFGAAAGNPGQGYYSYDIGAWHLIALNSNCGDAGGCSSSSPQGQWLEADLAAHSNMCVLAYWHIPLFSSGGRAASNTQSFWQSLYNHNADLILAGHDHIYERFAPQSPSGTLDTVRGIRQLTVGSGGANHTTLASLAANSEVHNVDTFGVLKLTLHPTSYDWQFVPEAGKTFTDSGTTSCHGLTSDVTPPTNPTNLVANAVAPGQVNLAWTASTDNVGVVGYQVFRDNVQIATSPTASFSDTGLQPQTTHSYKVVAFDAGGNFSAASNIASATTPADTVPPSAPTNLTATTNGLGQVNLTWNASTDNVSVAGYRVFRNGIQIDTVSTPSYTDATAAANTTYNYYVVAFDPTGNTSGSSNIVTITTPPPPTNLTFTPTGDTYVQSDVPTTNFGSAPQVVVDNSPIRNVLIKFTVSGVGTRQVVSAKLRLYCEDPSGVGGAFYKVADNSWNEGTVTWNNAPAADPNSFATLGAVVAGNWYEVDVSSLVTGDGTFGLKMVSTSGDGAYYASKEGTAGFAPQLVLVTNAPMATPAPTTTPSVNTPTASPTGSPTAVPTITPTASQTPSPIASFTPTPSVTSTPVLSSTSTSTPSLTSTPSATPSPTGTPTLTASPTATSTPIPIIDPIFSDGFESGDLSAWSSTVTDGVDLSVSPAAALNGAYGIQAVINDNNAIYMTDNTPNAELRYRVRFYFDPNSIVMADRDSHYLLYGYADAATPILRVELRSSKGNYQLRAAARNDSNGWANSAWTTIGDAAHFIELDWRAASIAGANDGSLTFWIDGAQVASSNGIDNDTRRIDSVQVGAVAEIDSGTRGTYYFDAFESRRVSYIGP
jgi:acid phosphatase type 7